MPEREVKVQVVEVNYLCDKCEQSELAHADNSVLLTNPPRYRYVCPNCGDRQTLAENYPVVRYKPIGDDR